MKIFSLPAIVLLSLVFLTGCAVYHPQTADIPLIDHKGELIIDAGASLIPSFHSTFSYGLTDRIALQAYGSVGFEHRRYVQFSPGLYKSLKNKKVLEFYSGLGLGKANTIKDPLANMPERVKQSLYGNYQLYFVQLNWGKNSAEPRELGWGLGLKTGFFHSHMTDENYYNLYSDGETFPVYSDNSILVEPVLSFRIGREKAKFTYKFAFTRIFKLNHIHNFIPAPVMNMSLGLNFKL